MEIPPGYAWVTVTLQFSIIFIFKKISIWPSVFERVKDNQLMMTLVVSDMAVCIMTFH